MPVPEGQRVMSLRQRLFRPGAIVFVSNACIMTLELVASRLIAPRLGVSLYTWTSVIGVILAGISLGNYVGGRLADRWASPRLLGLMFFQQFAFAGLQQLLALFSLTQLEMNATSNAALFTYVGMIVVVVQGGLAGAVVLATGG